MEKSYQNSHEKISRLLPPLLDRAPNQTNKLEEKSHSINNMQ